MAVSLFWDVSHMKLCLIKHLISSLQSAGCSHSASVCVMQIKIHSKHNIIDRVVLLKCCSIENGSTVGMQQNETDSLNENSVDPFNVALPRDLQQDTESIKGWHVSFCPGFLSKQAQTLKGYSSITYSFPLLFPIK